MTFLWPWSGNFRPCVLENGRREFLSRTRARPTDVLRHVTLEMNVATQPYQDVSDSACQSSGIISVATNYGHEEPVRFPA